MNTMILRRSLTLTSTLLGLLTSLALITAGCSPSDPGDGDGGSGGGNASGTGGAANPAGYSFCVPATTCPPDVSGVDLNAAVSFKNDINPILFEACSGGSGCHQTATTTGLAFSMGSPKVALDDAAQQALVTYLTTSMSKVSPSTPLVSPANWQNSFLMMKLDGCQNQMGLTCTPEAVNSSMVCEASEDVLLPCGDGMPQSESTPSSPVPFPLSTERLTKFRAWIQQGATFN
jgi:hypothetical protein